MITLTYAGNTLTLPNAKLGEPLNLRSGSKVHYGMDGTIYTYATGMSRAWTLTLENMKDADVANLRNWLASYAGQDITYIDHLGDTYTVHLMSPTIEITQLRDCQYSTILELQRKYGT